MIYCEELNVLMEQRPYEVARIAKRWGGFRGLRTAVLNGDPLATSRLQPVWNEWITDNARNRDERAATLWKRVFG